MPPSTPSAQLDAASAAPDRFLSIHKEIIALSRRNSDVRSLALGDKRQVTADCEAHLQTLDEALANHEFTATRYAWLISRQSQSGIRPKVR